MIAYLVTCLTNGKQYVGITKHSTFGDYPGLYFWGRTVLKGVRPAALVSVFLSSPALSQVGVSGVGNLKKPIDGFVVAPALSGFVSFRKRTSIGNEYLNNQAMDRASFCGVKFHFHQISFQLKIKDSGRLVSYEYRCPQKLVIGDDSERGEQVVSFNPATDAYKLDHCGKFPVIGNPVGDRMRVCSHAPMKRNAVNENIRSLQISQCTASDLDRLSGYAPKRERGDEQGESKEGGPSIWWQQSKDKSNHSNSVLKGVLIGCWVGFVVWVCSKKPKRKDEN